MRFMMALAVLAGLSTAVMAADAIPDLKGTWTGTSKSVVFGNNGYHPGTQKPSDPPRVGEQAYTFEIEGQDGRVLWGRTWANANPQHSEPLALAILADGKTVVGSDERRQPLHHHRLAGSSGALLHPQRQRPHRLDRGKLRLSRARQEIGARSAAVRPPRSSPARGRGRAGKAASMRAISASLSRRSPAPAFSATCSALAALGIAKSDGRRVEEGERHLPRRGAVRGGDLARARARRRVCGPGKPP